MFNNNIKKRKVIKQTGSILLHENILLMGNIN